MLRQPATLFSVAALAAGLAFIPGSTFHDGTRPSPLTVSRTVVAPNDTIYALAVDSAAYREYAFVYLLDDGVARFEADGRGTRTYHQVVQILKQSGVARWAEQRVAYQPDRENVTVNWMRVVRPSGEIVSDKPTQSQVSDVPASTVNPVYTATKVIRYSLSNVTPGTLVDLSWTIETTHPAMPGDIQLGWNFSVAAPGLRSRYVLDVPASYAPHIVEQHLDFKPTVVNAGGRRVYTWARQNLLPPKGELFAPDSSVPVMSLHIGAPIHWVDIGRWYNGLARDRYVLTPTLAQQVDSIVRGAKSYADTLAALHGWIASDLRYVSIALGIGGYQPRFPEATVGTGFGDCKDKATLFIAAAKHVGITAYPVLLNAAGTADSSFPAIEQFNHVIAAIPDRGKVPYTFLDLTTDRYPVGEVPNSYQGAFGLVVLPDGSSRDVTFPRDSAGGVDQRFVGELDTAGRVSGTLSLIAHGSAETSMRAAYFVPPDSAQRANMTHGTKGPFPDATVDTVVLFDARNRSAPATIDIVFRNGDGARPAGSMMILTIPSIFRGLAAAYRPAIEVLQRAGPRKLPIDPTRVAGPAMSRRELRLQLPVGWTAQLPLTVHTTGPFGTYDAQYTQVGRELRIVHTMTGGTAIQPPSQVGTLIDWLQKIVKDDAEFVPLVRGG